MVTRRTLLGASSAAGVGMFGTPRKRGRKILIRGGTVMPMDGPVFHGDVLIHGNVIEKVDEHISDHAYDVINASGMLVMPGLIDNHRHLWEGNIRGVSADHSFQDYFGQVLFGISPTVTPDQVYHGTRLSVRDAIDSGVTTILDWAHATNTFDHVLSGLRALINSDIRAVYAYSSPASDSSPDAPPNFDELVHAQFYTENHGQGRVSFAVAAHNPENALPRARTDIEWARRLEVPITMHAGLIPGTTAPKLLDEENLLGPDMTFIHGNTFTAEDFSLIGNAGAHISCSPIVEMQMGLGVPEITAMSSFGVNITVSADIVAATTGDLFSQLRILLAGHRLMDGEITLKSWEMIPYITTNAAKSLMIGDKVGTLTPGKLADIIIIDLSAPNLTTATPENALVQFAHPGNVHTVIIDGKVKKHRGRLV